jgi:type I restriction enzyme M protein
MARLSCLPINALIDDGPATVLAKKELLESHTLTAVMSMPPQLFPGVGTVAAIAVLEAHRPHHRAGKPRMEALDTQVGFEVIDEDD